MSHSLHDFAASDHDHRNRACQCGPVGWVVVRRSAGACSVPVVAPLVLRCVRCAVSPPKGIAAFRVSRCPRAVCSVPIMPFTCCYICTNAAKTPGLHTAHTPDTAKHTRHGYRDARVRARTRSRATQWTPVSGVSTVPRDDHAPAAPRRPLRRSRLGATGSRAWGCRVPARRRG